MSQVKELAEQVIAAVKGYVSPAIASVTARLDQFDAKLKAIPTPQKGEPGKDAEFTDEDVDTALSKFFEKHPLRVPEDGKSVTTEDVLPQLRAELAKAVEAIAKPLDGKDADPELIASLVSAAVAALPPAVNGKDADPEHVATLVSERVTKAVEALPKPTDGKNGLNAFEVAVSLGFEGTVHDWMKSLEGKPGAPGYSVTAAQVLPELTAELQKAIAALPVPKNGDPGKDSKVTAEDFRTLFEAEQAKALLDLERRANDMLQRAIDRIQKPKDGENGRDAIDLATFDIQVDDDFRTWRVSAQAGDQRVEKTLYVAVPVFQGVWQPGEYKRGDIVSFGGSAFIARRDTTSKPETDDSFTLFVKRGRDGKDVAKVERADPGPIRLR